MLISWNITRRCNLTCKHCYRESSPDADSSRELSTREGKRLLEQVREAGFLLVILSGGEPLIRADVFELVRYASHIGLRPVLGTNGTLLGADAALRLKNSGAAGVGISLDSTEPEYHDGFRRMRGAHEKAIHGIRCALDAGLRVQINMTLTEENFGGFDSMVDLAGELGVSAIHPFFLLPAGRGGSLEKDVMSRNRHFGMLRAILNRQKNTDLELKPTCAPQFLPMAREMGLNLRFSRGCLAGLSYCCILPEGQVHVCPYLPVEAGNVRLANFSRIWEESKVFIRLRGYGEYGGRCGRCEHAGICGGCRARAYYRSNGNYMSQDPWCYKYA